MPSSDSTSAFFGEFTHLQAKLVSLQRENAELRKELNRRSNPYTIEIQNQATGQWFELAHDAPLSLADAEQLLKDRQRDSPQAKLRITPWLNSAQRQLVNELRATLEAAESDTRRRKAALDVLHDLLIVCTDDDDKPLHSSPQLKVEVERSKTYLRDEEAIDAAMAAQKGDWL